ncbi:bifunctional oligoribonuclease/PAP phosphatase NrnA [Virgibacillus soli]|uniref:DHH family phosphoesterase n=1 Tax=Paracerasibacillus soli TaxID=480284 RepID=UPI0035EF56AE
MEQIQIIDAILESETIIIHRHVRPDPDAIGSQAGLGELIKHSFPDKQVYIVGESDPSLAYLTEMDQVEDTLYQHALVIVCDTANTERIDDQRYSLGRKLIKIDHHPNDDTYGEIQWVDTKASSTCEMIYELYEQGKNHGFKMNEEVARLLYAGMVSDTGRFLFLNTTSRTMEVVAKLISYHFDRQQLFDSMYNMEGKIAKLKGFVLQQYTLSPNGVCYIKLTKELLKEFDVTSVETSQFVGVLGDIEGVLTWVMFVEEEDLIRVRLRSKGPEIHRLAAKYNGGGHPRASGASVKSWEDVDALLTDLEHICAQY